MYEILSNFREYLTATRELRTTLKVLSFKQFDCFNELIHVIIHVILQASLQLSHIVV